MTTKPKFSVSASFSKWNLQTITFMNDTQFFVSLDNKERKIHWMVTGRDELGLKVLAVKGVGHLVLGLNWLGEKILQEIQDTQAYTEALLLNIPYDMFKRLYRPDAVDKYELINMYIQGSRR